MQRPHPPLWSACGSDETARLTGSLGMGGLFGSEGGPDRVQQLMALYQDALRTAPGNGAGPTRRAALMTAGYCHEDPRVVAERGTELVGWYIEQQRERARLVWRDYDPTTVPPDYQGYYARDQRLASGPHPGEPTPQEVREQGTSFCVGTPAECIRFLELYEALGIEEVFLLCAIGPAQHDEVLHTIRLFGEQIIPHFQAREPLYALNYSLPAASVDGPRRQASRMRATRPSDRHLTSSLSKRLGGLRGFHGFTACHFHYCLSLGKIGPKMIDPFPEQIGATIFRPPCHFGPVCTFPLGFRRALGSLRPITKRSDGCLQRCYGLDQVLVGFQISACCGLRPLWWNKCTHNALVVLLPSPTPTQHQPDRRRRGYPACFSQFRVAHPSTVRGTRLPSRSLLPAY